MSDQVAFAALQELANRSRQHAKALPAQVNAAPRWSGIGFSLLGLRFVAPLGQIAEMLEVPATTRLPGVQPWILGLANVRGKLLPMCDLAMFLGGRLSPHKKSHRVLVVDQGKFFCGLIVDQAFGMQHFTSEVYMDEVEDAPESVKPVTNGAYRDAAGNQWAVMHIPALLADPRFANAALG